MSLSSTAKTFNILHYPFLNSNIVNSSMRSTISS